MAIASRLMGCGLPAAAALQIVGDVSSPLTATGINQATALQISNGVGYVTTTPSGTGVMLFQDANTGDSQTIYNYGANALNVYPPVGETIQGEAINAALSLTSNSKCIFEKVSSTTWIADATFVPSGTGAITRTVQAKLRDRVSVKDFGAAGDGVTDDAAAIQAALNAVTAGSGVYFPDGTYSIGTALTVKDYTTIEGASWNTILSPTSAPASLFDLTGNRGVKIKNMRLKTTQTTSPYQHVLLGPGAFFNTLEHLYLAANAKTSGQSAIALTSDGTSGAFWNILVDLQIASIHRGIDLSSTGSQGQNANRISFSRIDDVVDGIVLGGGSGNGADYNVICGVTIGSFSTDGIRVASGSDFNIGQALVFEGTSGSTVIRCSGNDNRWELVHASPDGTDTITNGGNRNSYREISRSNLFTNVTGGSWWLNETVSIRALLVNTRTNAGYPFDVSGTARITGDVTLTSSLSVTGPIYTSIPNTQTGATYAVATSDNTIIANRAGTVTLTLPAVASFPKRKIRVVTIQNQTVVSDASNVVPLVGGSASTAILSGTAGKWADLECDGTNWIVTAGN